MLRTTWLSLAQQGSKFSDISEPDWTANLLLYLFLAAMMAMVYLWGRRRFEEAVDAAAGGEAVSIRGAYSGFWMLFGTAGILSLAAVIASCFFNIKSWVVTS